MPVFHSLLITCYELGHQPLALAWPYAQLQGAGCPTQTLDLAVESLSPAKVGAADFIAIATPMHTALRLGVAAARQIRHLNPEAHLCFYGLYAWLNADYLLTAEPGEPALADSIISGEVETILVNLVRGLAAGQSAAAIVGVRTAQSPAGPNLKRLSFVVPDRTRLPPLSEYARYVSAGLRYQAGYVESSRGCLHTCRHCPVVPVYNGRFFVVPADIVLADIDQQVAAGARHITFGDPDFLNGPKHALKIARELHRAHPNLTFDFTTKVEHILKHRERMAELRASGATFVISAFEATAAHVLQRLDKGHTVADMTTALTILTDAGLAVQPTWVPFTPWTSLTDFLDMLHWIRQHDLVYHVPPVQYGIRLLVPPKSALLSQPDAATWFQQLDAANFTYRWQHPDPCMDQLQVQVARIAERMSDDTGRAFAQIEAAAYRLASRPLPDIPLPTPPDQPPPRLTEDWFC